MEDTAKTIEANKKIARKITKAFEDKDLDTVAELCDKDYKLHFPGFPEPLGFDEAKKNNEEYMKAFPNSKIVVDLVVAENDMVAVHCTYTGKHEGELQGMAPSGKDIEVSGVSLYKIKDGKVVEEWDEFDALGMMQQIGAIPEPEHA